MAEWINEDVPLRSRMRELFAEQGVVSCKNARGKKDVEEAQKYRDYFDFQEPLKRCAGHRFLAMMRGMDQGFLKLSVEPDESRAMAILRRHCLHGYSDASDQVKLAMEDAYSRLLQPSLENESSYTFSLIDLNGKKVLEQTIENPQLIETVSLDGLAKGMYLEVS